MNKIISWMIDVENSVANLYAEAATVFVDDERFSQFLSRLAEEEQDHIRLLKEALASLSIKSMGNAIFYFDEDFRRKIEAPIKRAEFLLGRKKLTQDGMVDVIADVEFSEWNELLIYILDSTKVLGEDFQKTASELDQHRIHIQDYIFSLPENESLLQKVRRLRHASDKRILIVEDNKAVARMLEALAMSDAEVVIASDGEEGIASIREGHFDLVITDIEMPKMNGIEFYKKAISINPKLESRFIFFSGTDNPEYLRFLKLSNVVLLPKPSPVKFIHGTILDILESSSKQETTLH